MSPKITADMLAFIISSFCQIKDPNITKTQKMDCLDFAVNCIIVQDGTTANTVVDECREKWIDIERRNRVQGR